MSKPSVILDTNLFVAAGFNRQSASARIIAEVRQGNLRLIWNETTRSETRHILNKIPRLSWDEVAELFEEQNCQVEDLPIELFTAIPDPDDRKFAALAHVSGATLLTSDDHLLSYSEATFAIMSPSDFWRAYAGQSRK